MTAPSVDVVIPTLNCAENLDKCLGRIRAQDYPGDVEIFVVDGGSADDTLRVAKGHGAHITLRAGQYGYGLSGARNLGNRLGRGSLIWCVDSDNFLVESSAALDLVEPLARDSTIQVTLPLGVPDSGLASFSNWLTLNDAQAVQRMGMGGRRIGDYLVVDPMNYGLTNCCLIRRNALEAVGGYDADFRVLARLRSAGIARGAIVPTAHFVHRSAESFWTYRRKWSKRILRYATMSEPEIAAYFVPMDPDGPNLGSSFQEAVTSVLRPVVDGTRNLLRTGDPTWIWGVVYPIAWLSIFAAHPRIGKSALARFGRA